MDTLNTLLFSIYSLYANLTSYLHNLVTDTCLEFWLLNYHGQWVTLCSILAIVSFTIAFRMGLSQDIKAGWNCITRAKKGAKVHEARRRFSNLARGVGHGDAQERLFDKRYPAGDAGGNGDGGDGGDEGKSGKGRKAELQKRGLFNPNGTLTRSEAQACGAFGAGSGRVEQLVRNDEDRARMRLEVLRKLDRDEQRHLGTSLKKFKAENANFYLDDMRLRVFTSAVSRIMHAYASPPVSQEQHQSPYRADTLIRAYSRLLPPHPDSASK
ncbi:hypothetical protein CC80DRAFT_500775 [Byssothecium circinans]|uniref:Uncharacterized protein n=1 Tax=Byssothecium circinans TaxID=147558 RepID=A0A6A5UC48_9PLEO|nr:hypothetical protein CC80DRAFT_500775 [Byssothecium circinans]